MSNGARSYTEREASFLRLAALLSGYFLRRQFNEFIGKECGVLAQRFIEHGVARGDFLPLPTKPVIYHVAASSLYASLGDPENRNRRTHEIEAVRRRLMALDFSLKHVGARWLLTEQAKIERFSAYGVSLEDLPGESFGKKALGKMVKRYFVDRQPIALEDGGGATFAFIDEGLKTFSRFELFLKAHRALMQALPATQLVFATCEEARFARAKELFRRHVAAERPSGATDVERLSRYFAARKLIDQKQFQHFDQARLDELREEKRVFSGSQFEELYGRWLQLGDEAFLALRPLRFSLRLTLLPHRYEWLSRIRY